MNYTNLKNQWKKEEDYSFHGWDFSHIDDRWEHKQLPWDYFEIATNYIKKTDKILDMGTGGGEFLLSLSHPYELTSVTEAYPPNVELCKQTLVPLGITVAQTYDDNKLPFNSNAFDIIINKHEDFDLIEVDRVLKSGGYFITQQVGEKNNNDLSAKVISGFKPQFGTHNLNLYLETLSELKYEIVKSDEYFYTLKFFDVGALTYYAKIIEWEFTNFSVDKCFENLCNCQNELDENGFITGTSHRFIIICKKP